MEVSAESGVILEHLAARLEEDGGFALFADYGHDGNKTDTFRVSFVVFCTILIFLNLFCFLIKKFKFKLIVHVDTFFQHHISL